MGICPDNFIVLADEAISGTCESRPGFDELKKLIYSDRLGIMIVAEQSRLSRGANAKSLIKDIVYHGGRFLSVSEGIDTTRKGWETIVGISQIHHSHSNTDTAERVRAGQEGRVRDGDGSAGDYPYGYESEYVDPVAAADYRGRGPKPKRKVVIEPNAAVVVQEVFQRFANNESMTKIVEWWNNNLDKFPQVTNKAGARIRIDLVRRMLLNPKYTGVWPWGVTTMVYDGNGKGKQIPARPDQSVVVASRPHLRIIDQQLWDKTVARFAALKAIYGMKPDGQKRGPAAGYRLLYERSLLGGKVHCALCGAKLLVIISWGNKHLRCPNRRLGTCSMSVTIPYLRAENGVLSILADVLKNYPGWLQLAMKAMREELERASRAIPAELQHVESELHTVTVGLNRLIESVSTGEVRGQTVSQRIDAMEATKADLQARIAQLQCTRPSRMQMPSDAWVAEQLKSLTAILKQEMATVARHLRPLLTHVMAEQVKIGKQKSGRARLRFTIDGWAVLAQILGDRLPEGVLAQLQPGESKTSQEFHIELGKETAIHKWAPQIVGWREQKVPVTWSEIAKRTGLTSSTAYHVYKYWKDRNP
jgi:hypothetical protein